MALGLIGSDQLDDYWSRNVRRRVAYDFPQGSAPLTALMSLMDNDFTPIQEFGWQEERWQSLKTKTSTTGQPTSDIVFYNGGGTVSAGTPITITAGLSLRAYVDDASIFQVDDTIMFFGLTLTSGTGDLQGVVTSRNATTSPYWVEFSCTNVPASTVVNSSAAEGKYVYVQGSAFAEGSRSRSGRSKFPITIMNYTQIHKNAFELTGNALKAPLTYNKSGHYQKALKDNGIDHLAGLERTALWGKRRKENNVTDADNGDTVFRYQSGGLLYFLEQWEKGTTGDFSYPHNGGTDNVFTQTDWQTYTDKRIIKLANSTITKGQFDKLMTRLFEKNNGKTWDKLCLCGPDYLGAVTDSFEKRVQVTSMRENGYKGWDFKFVEHSTNSGTVYYKVHPLMRDPLWRSSAFYIDLGFLNWRPVSDRDTFVKTGCQANDADKRKDMYFTEGGIEVWFPEAHMFVDGLAGITL